MVDGGSLQRLGFTETILHKPARPPAHRTAVRYYVRDKHTLFSYQLSHARRESLENTHYLRRCRFKQQAVQLFVVYKSVRSRRQYISDHLGLVLGQFSPQHVEGMPQCLERDQPRCRIVGQSEHPMVWSILDEGLQQ